MPAIRCSKRIVGISIPPRQNRLSLLFELFARIASPTLPSAKLWIIAGDSASCQAFLALLQKLFPKIERCDYSIVLSKHHVLSLYDSALSGIVATYYDSHNLPEQYLQRKQAAMKAFVLGKPISKSSDPLFATNTAQIRSSLAVLFFANDESPLPKSFSGIPTKTIRPQNFTPPQLSDLDIQWLQSTAVYIGLRQIYTQGEPILCPPTQEILAFLISSAKRVVSAIGPPLSTTFKSIINSYTEHLSPQNIVVRKL